MDNNLINLPEKATDIRLRQWERQENIFKNISEKIMWLCEIADTCPLDGTPDKQTTGYGDTQVEAYNDAVKKWEND